MKWSQSHALCIALAPTHLDYTAIDTVQCGCIHCIHCFSQRIVLHFCSHQRTHSNANKGRVNVNDSFALCMSNGKESMEIRKPALMLRIQFSPIHDDINQTEQFIFIIIPNYNELTQLKIINFPPVFFSFSLSSPVDLVSDWTPF